MKNTEENNEFFRKKPSLAFNFLKLKVENFFSNNS